MFSFGRRRRNRHSDSSPPHHEMTSSRSHHVASHGRSHSDRRAPRSNPSVLYGARHSQIGGTIRPGAACAVGGTQVIQRISSSSHPSLYPDSNPAYHIPNPNPSVLYEYNRHDSRLAQAPGTSFGEAAFSAVGGHREVISGRGGVSRVVSGSDVLPRQNQLPLPGNLSNHGSPSFPPGSYTAVGGYYGPEESSPNVLKHAQGFYTDGGTLEVGSFTAVGRDQRIFLDGSSASRSRSNRR